MRLIRFGKEPSQVGADVRAALATWGSGENILGGVALLGVQPPGCPRVLDALVVLPRGVLVVVGVDLPDPAMRLEAPLAGPWRIDGWPLTRSDGAVSPAGEALDAAAAVANRLQLMRAEPLPVSTIVAVGPYVDKVVQPTTDLNRGVRVLHPEPGTLLAAARELATCDRPCGVSQAHQVIGALLPAAAAAAVRVGDLRVEGFPEADTAPLATASTTLLPRVPTRVPPAPQPAGAAQRRAPRWLPFAAAGLIGGLLVGGIAVAVGSSRVAQSAGPGSPTTNPVTVAGTSFLPRGADSNRDCAAHAYGDVRTWLTENPCRELRRAQYETTVDGRAVGVWLAEVRFDDNTRADEFRTRVSTAGAGGITDLASEGTRWDGGPESFDQATFASSRTGSTVRLAQAVWTEGGDSADDPQLDELTEQALQLPSIQ